MYIIFMRVYSMLIIVGAGYHQRHTFAYVLLERHRNRVQDDTRGVKSFAVSHCGRINVCTWILSFKEYIARDIKTSNMDLHLSV